MIFVAVLYSLLIKLFNTALPSNYILSTRSKYGETTFHTIRKIEKLSTKLQKCKCDLEFIRLCLIYNLTPTFVKIKLWKKRIKTTSEFSHFKQFCLKKEYQNRYKDSIKYETETNKLMDNLKTKMTYSDYILLQKYLYERSRKVQEKVTNIHQKKLEKLNNGKIGHDYYSLREKLIHNISSYTLSPTEERLLCRGWDFWIENKITNFIEFKTDMELNAFKLQTHCHPSAFSTICRKLYNYSEIYMGSLKKKIIRNISDDEFSALKSLRNNRNIVICRADKGNCIVILDKKDYIEKINQILELKQFKSAKDTLLIEQENSMNKYILKLYKENVIDKETYWNIHSTSSSYATMYGQPKVHKTNYPLRPIILSIGSYNYDLSKYLYKIIKQNRPNQSFSFVKNSFEFVKKIMGIKDSANQIMVSFDVDNLYTNVPVHEAIKITLDMLFKNPNSPSIPFNRSQFKQLLEYAVCNVPFRFLDRKFVQIDGVAMGSPLGPILADLFMSNLEQKLNKFSTNKPLIWIRYVDDIFCIFKNNQNIKDFLIRINKWHPNVKFTPEHEYDDKLSFLDVLIQRDNLNNVYKTSLYRKPTNANLYLLYESNQSRKYKLSLIRTLVIRIHLICSTDELKESEVKLMKETLITNGYPAHIIKKGIREGEVISNRILKGESKELKKPSEIKTIYFLITYCGQESTILAHRIKQICKKLLPFVKINVCFKKTFTIKNIFLPLQKGLDNSKKNKNLIYRIPCLNCNKCYVDETSRNKQTRMKEHESDVRMFIESSNVAKHANTENHSFDFTRPETLSLESNWRRRTIKESLFSHQM